MADNQAMVDIGPFEEEEQVALLDIYSEQEILQKLHAIKSIESKITDLKILSDQARLFYDKRISSLVDRIDFMKGQIAGYLETKGKNSIATHLGTISFRTTTTRQWPDDEVLIQWCKQHAPELVKAFVTEKVDKAALLKKMREIEDAPGGFVEQITRRLVISRGGTSNETEQV